MLTSTRVPFTTEAFAGLAKVHGLVHVEESGLRLEFETKDSVIQFFKSGMREVLVPWAELESVDFKKALLSGGMLIIKSVRMAALADVPGHQHGTAKLNIARAHRTDAERVVDMATMRMAEARLAELQREPLP